MTPNPQTVAIANEAMQIALQMFEERGRGAVLVGVARVDTALERLLQAVMAPSSEKSDGLFKAERPLGSFGAKIALARRLNLIDESLERALNVLRRLRNDFAHSTELASLASPTNKSKLEGVYREAQVNPLWTSLGVALASQPPSSQGELDADLRDYIRFITIVVAFLEASVQVLQPLVPAVTVGLARIAATQKLQSHKGAEEG
jgi:hypothetical protein